MTTERSTAEERVEDLNSERKTGHFRSKKYNVGKQIINTDGTGKAFPYQVLKPVVITST